MDAAKLPTFSNPPVIETVLGVQFDRIPGLTNAHLGAFWAQLRGKATVEPVWDEVEDAAPIDFSFERFGEEDAWRPIGTMLKLSDRPESRVRIRSRDKEWMLQVQDGRFHLNWIGRPGAEYRRYQIVRPAFDRAYAAFSEFLQAEKLGRLAENQWEVTYVNHMPQGTVWNTPEDWPKLLPGLPGVWAKPSSVELESFRGLWHFMLPGKVGRLHVEVAHIRADTGPALRVTLTARGPVSAGGGFQQGLDTGRAAVVATFSEVTSGEAHAYWGLVR